MKRSNQVPVHLLFLTLLTAEASKNERKLLRDLLHDYNVMERPVTNDSHTVTVEMGFTIDVIVDIVSYS